MIEGKTPLIPKDQNTPLKGTALSKNRLITCLPVTWQILTVQIMEEIYYSLVSREVFPEEQKRCRKGTRETGDLLYIDQHILKESKMTKKCSHDED